MRLLFRHDTDTKGELEGRPESVFTELPDRIPEADIPRMGHELEMA